MQRLDLRRGEGQRVDEALRALPVARDEAQRDRALLARLGEREGEIGDNERVKPFGDRGERDGAPLGEAADGLGEAAWRRGELVHERKASLAKASRGAWRSRANNGV